MKIPKIAVTSQSEYIIEAIEVCKLYYIETNSITALQNANLQIKPGEVVAIMGPSGSGKTTLLNCLSGLDESSSGTIKIVGYDLKGLTDDELTTFRALHMGFIFQTYNLLPVLTGLENVELPLLVSGIRPKEARKRALEAIDNVGMADWSKHRPAEMSGGQRQRFTLARALATNPAIVWADEPTGALDSKTSREIIDLMLDLNRQHNLTFVWVTHAPEVGTRAQRLIKMQDGKIIEDSALMADAKNI